MAALSELGRGGSDHLLLAGACRRRRDDRPRRVPRRHSERRVVEQSQLPQPRLGSVPGTRLGCWSGWSMLPGMEEITRSCWTPGHAAVTNTAGSVVSSCGRPPRTPGRPVAGGCTSTLSRTSHGSTSTPVGFGGPTLVLCTYRQVDLPGSAGNATHARLGAHKRTHLRTWTVGARLPK
jgi:hypothetical protein